MNVEAHQIPSNHLVITNFFTETELKKIWNELRYLTNLDILNTTDTSPATDSDGNILKKNFSIFLTQFYCNINHSQIFSVLKNKITHDLCAGLNNNLEKVFKQCNFLDVLVNYYDDNSEYKFHYDDSIFTMSTLVYQEPKNFTGGDFHLGNKSHKIHCENNSAIIFLGSEYHAVSPVKLHKSSPFLGLGRYSITVFFYTVPIQFSNFKFKE